MAGAGWWVGGVAAGCVSWALVRGRVTAIVVDRRTDRTAPRWLDTTGWVSAAAAMGLALGRTERPGELAGLSGFTLAMVVLAVIDAATMTLPRQLVWGATAWVVVALGAVAAADGDGSRVGRAAAASAIAVGAVWAMRAATRGGIGFGDVRLAAPLGWAAGWVSWGTLGRAGFLAVTVNAAVSLLAIALGNAGRRTKIPLGPSLVLGTLLALYVFRQST